jgi:hypothetical protein
MTKQLTVRRPDARRDLSAIVRETGRRDRQGVDDWGRTFTGREAIRGWSDAEFIGQRVTLAVTEVSTGADVAEAVVTAQVGGDGFNGPSHFTFRAAGDQLASMKIRA